MTTINPAWLDQNRREPVGFPAAVVSYGKTTSGAQTLMTAAQRTIRLAGLMVPSLGVSALELPLGKASDLLSVFFLPGVTKDVANSLSELEYGHERKILNAAKNAADATSTWCTAASLISSHEAIGHVSKISDGIFDGADLRLSYQDYRKSAELEGAATGEIKELFTHSKDYYWLRIARAVASIASMILGIVALATAHWVIGAALVCISLISVMFSIIRDTHEISGKYPILKFDHPIHV
ncbi:MAG: hypothetical protein KGQ49_04940 [Verrucomicrobia bacterium]|nr:hypothetical protein [Verrucomicrobiota bacterium]MBU6446726.1 hypothetical protein [Verrucomicrobiota bacterium]